MSVNRNVTGRGAGLAASALVSIYANHRVYGLGTRFGENAAAAGRPWNHVAMAPLDELAPGLLRFSRRRQGIPPMSTAYVLHDDVGTILVDPLVRERDTEVLEALDGLVRGGVRILVTIPFHVRGSELLWRRWRDRHEVAIFGH